MTDEALEGLAQIVRRCLEAGHRVEIERLGTFQPSPDGGFSFLPDMRPTVFLAYVEEDRAAVSRLYRLLAAGGFRPWMDQKNLKPGQNWPRAIDGAIATSDFFIACLSQRSVNKLGTFQSEMRYALDCARRVPLDGIYFLPARLEPCRVPACIGDHVQWVNLFPDFAAGAQELITTMRNEMARRARSELTPAV